MNIVRKCVNNQFSRKCWALARAPKWEHYFFVIYAGIEVAGAHALLWYASGGLLITGAGAVVYDTVTSDQPKTETE